METFEKIQIAERVPPGDKWKLLDEDNIYESLTDTLEAYFQKTGFKGDYLLSPLDSKLYIITFNEIKEVEKRYSFYGEFKQGL